MLFVLLVPEPRPTSATTSPPPPSSFHKQALTIRSAAGRRRGNCNTTPHTYQPLGLQWNFFFLVDRNCFLRVIYRALPASASAIMPDLSRQLLLRERGPCCRMHGGGPKGHFLPHLPCTARWDEMQRTNTDTASYNALKHKKVMGRVS